MFLRTQKNLFLKSQPFLKLNKRFIGSGKTKWEMENLN